MAANPSPTPTQTTDWSKCALSQLASKEQLTCPTDTGYKTTAENILHFHDLYCMPVQVDVSRLDQGNGIESTFKEHKTKWHKSCYLKFTTNKLERAKERKRKSTEEVTTSKRIFKRSSTGEADVSVESKSPVCFFCSKPETRSEKLPEVSTFQVDFRVRKCAHELRDENLLTKLCAGTDIIALEAKYHARCLTNLYNKARLMVAQEPGTSSDQTRKGITLAELIPYIEERMRALRCSDLLILPNCTPKDWISLVWI